MKRIKPDFFEKIYRDRQKRWEQLEKDPELAGPWKQLFRQVQSPRHVLSELLQNADDAGARRVRVWIEKDVFYFEHDGHDFTEAELASLCRFGFSNKRTLHTIGFRGIGFKSTFSLGDSVQLLTPTLAIRFEKQRFTLPIWIEEAPPCEKTQISVRIQDEARKEALQQNLNEWIETPASLLFFSHIEELEIDGRIIQKQRVGEGPVAGSEVIRLVSEREYEVWCFTSEPEPFPDEVLKEISQERDVEDLNLPPCRVQLVVGLPGSQRLYTVLPTGVEVDLPFSCNAPFLQDPARSGIKDPATSPTNRWLLERIGRLAGRCMKEWLANPDLSPEKRARAYELLPPPPPREGSSIETEAFRIVCGAFIKAIDAHPILLTIDGKLVHREACLAPPRSAYKIWKPDYLPELFQTPHKSLLSPHVSDKHRRILAQWNLLKNLDEEHLVSRLKEVNSLRRPDSYEGLLKLWSLVWEHRKQLGAVYWQNSDPLFELPLIPVSGEAILYSASQVVRLPQKHENLSEEAWRFLKKLVTVVESGWIEYLEGKQQEENKDLENAHHLLKELQLDRASNSDKIADNACRNLFSRQDLALQDYVNMAHLLAALDARTPESFRCITRDGQIRDPSNHIIIATEDPTIEELLPESWKQAHLLHEAYFKLERNSLCDREKWEKWLSSRKSGFFAFVPTVKKKQRYHDKDDVCKFLKARGYRGHIEFYAQFQYAKITDYDFPDELKQFWERKSGEDPAIWAKVLSAFLKAFSPEYWEPRTRVELKEANYNNERHLGISGDIKSGWLHLLSSKPCLFDTHGQPRMPAELYIRTYKTEPLLGVEPFVKVELDTEANKPLLKLLGARDTLASLEGILERLRALRKAPDPKPLLGEIFTWYQALDRILQYQREVPPELKRAFEEESLVLMSTHEWGRASEVFCTESEDFPDAPVIHLAVRELRLWRELGVLERPTEEHILHWLGRLRSDEVIPEGQIKAVKSALKCYARPIWTRYHHWLTLDNGWRPFSRLKYRLTMRRLTRWKNLHPHIKELTADFQMLPDSILEEEPFSQLVDLADAIEYRRVDDPTTTAGGTTPPWLEIICRYLQRVTFQGDVEKTRHVRSVASLLGQSRLVTLNGGKLRVRPYIDNMPAGTEEIATVIWDRDNKTIFVATKLIRCYEQLVEEISGPFNDPKITNAFRACIEREETFIAEYFVEHFTLSDSEIPFDQMGTADREADEEEAGELTPVARIEGTENEYENREVIKVRRVRSDRIFEVFRRYAESQGFQWDEFRGIFKHGDGSVLRRAESPFHWQHLDWEGNLIMRYWVATGLSGKSVIECPAEVFETLREHPEACSVLIEISKEIFLLSGREFIRRLDREDIKVYPAVYRLVFGSGLEQRM